MLIWLGFGSNFTVAMGILGAGIAFASQETIGSFAGYLSIVTGNLYHIGGGVPLGALLATDAVSCFQHGDQGGTYNGNPLMCAVGQFVVSAVGEATFLANVRAMANRLTKGLARLADKHGRGATRGRGLLIGWDLGRDDAHLVLRQVQRR